MTKAEAIAARTIAGVVKMHAHYDRHDPHAPSTRERLADALDTYAGGFTNVEVECIRAAVVRELDVISRQETCE